MRTQAEAEASTRLGFVVKRRAAGVWERVLPNGAWGSLTSSQQKLCRDILRDIYDAAHQDDDDTNDPGVDALWASARPFVPYRMRPMFNAVTSAIDTSGISKALGVRGIAGVTGAAGGYATGGVAGGIGGGLGGMIGAAGGPAGIAIGSTVGAVAGAALDKTFGAIKDNMGAARELGASIVDHITDGTKAVIQGAWKGGTAIADALASAVLKPFGASGALVGQFASQIGATFGKLLTSGLDMAGSLLQKAGGVAGLLFGVGAAGLGAVLLGPVSGLIGAALGTLVAKALLTVVDAVAGIISSVLQKLGAAFGELGELVGGFIRTFVGVLEDAINAANAFSRQVLSVSQHTGIGIGAAQSQVQMNAAFGMSAAQTASAYSPMNRMPLYQGPMDAALGISGAMGSEEHFRSVIEQARKLPLVLRRVMLQSQPEGEDFWLRIVGMPDEKIARQLDFSKMFRIPPSALQAFDQDVSMLMGSIGQFTEWAKVTLATAFLPAITKVLTGGMEFIRDHQKQIVEGIVDIGYWFYVKLPEYVLKGVSVIGHGLAAVFDSIANLLHSLRDNFVPFLSFIDTIANALRNVVLTAADWYDVATGNEAAWGIAQNWKPSNLAGNEKLVGAVHRSLDTAENRMRGAGTWTEGQTSFVDRVGRGVIGTEAERHTQYNREIRDDLRSLVQSSDRIAKNSERTDRLKAEIVVKTKEDLWQAYVETLIVDSITRAQDIG
jgi:hypothetical protein